MEVTAKLNKLRISPRKIRLVIDLLRGKNVTEATAQLRFMSKRAALPVLKLLNSAIANAEHNWQLVKSNLYIKRVTVDEAGMLKRWMPKAFGQATPIRLRMSNINLVLDEIVPSAVREKTAKKDKLDENTTKESIDNVLAKEEKIEKINTKKSARGNNIENKSESSRGKGGKKLINRIFNRKVG